MDSTENTNEDSSNQTLPNGEEIQAKILRGDSIGNTVYSERFVLQTLLKLKDNTWDEELEEDMCAVWDMTLDKAVVDFLLSCNFIDLTLDIIRTSKELRLIEILVGIISNLCIYDAAVEITVNAPNFDSILNLIDSDDPLILIQLMRLFKALLYCKNINVSCILSPNILQQLNFILTSAKNIELLSYCLQVTSEITLKNNTLFLDFDFLQSISEAYTEIINDVGKISLDQELEKHLPSYLKCIENSCNLINEQSDNEIQQILEKFDEDSITKTVKIIEKYLHEYTIADFVFESSNLEYFLYVSANFLVSFRTIPNTNIFKYYITLYKKIISDNMKDTFESDVCEYIYNYISYFVQSTNVKDLKTIVTNDVKILFKDVLLTNYDCTKKFKDIVNQL